MNPIHTFRLALSSGAVAGLAYVTCALAMRILPEDIFVYLANAYLHGVDVSSVINHGMPWHQALAGVVLTAMTAGILGGGLALIYNRTLARG